MASRSTVAREVAGSSPVVPAKISNKEKFLGMSCGKAFGRLRKMVLFDLLRRHSENFCFRCGGEIVSFEDLSIEHKKSWLYVSVDLFWDLENIAFSHLRCNKTDRPVLCFSDYRTRKIAPPGMAWCICCKVFRPVEEFYPDPRHWNGLKSRCKLKAHDKRGNHAKVSRSGGRRVVQRGGN